MPVREIWSLRQLSEVTYHQRMQKLKTTDPEFLAHVESCIDRHGEVLVLFRYPYAAGSKDYNFFHKIDEFMEAIRKLRSRTWVISYGEPQLPLRGVVDETFIDQALDLIPDGREYLILCIEKTVLNSPHFHSEYHDDCAGETHEELRESLERFRGRPVGVGLFPPWADENEQTKDAVVADEDGEVRSAAY